MGIYKFRDDIQSLRAIAVILVILYHIYPSLVPVGYIGVDIFFVISGYLISKKLFIFFMIQNYKMKKWKNTNKKKLNIFCKCYIFYWYLFLKSHASGSLLPFLAFSASASA